MKLVDARRPALHPTAESPQTQNEASDASQGPAETPASRFRQTNQLLEQQEARLSYFTRVQDLGTHLVPSADGTSSMLGRKQ